VVARNQGGGIKLTFRDAFASSGRLSVTSVE
jgi:hypothetical protein